jgi:hypothetical protein
MFKGENLPQVRHLTPSYGQYINGGDTQTNFPTHKSVVIVDSFNNSKQDNSKVSAKGARRNIHTSNVSFRKSNKTFNKKESILRNREKGIFDS